MRIQLQKPIHVVSVSTTSLVSVSPLHVFFPILPREEKLWQGKKEGKENNRPFHLLAPSNCC